VAARVRIFTRATSLGTVESLIEHRASVEGPETRTPDNLLRLSIGLEHPDDLIADLAEALNSEGASTAPSEASPRRDRAGEARARKEER
jgi:cystathionine gamma-synthase